MDAPENKTALGLRRDIGLRLVSGLTLAALALALTWGGGWGFAILIGGVALIVTWEWGRMVRGAAGGTIFVIHAISVGVAVLLSVLGLPALGLVALTVGAILAGILGFNALGLVSALGVFYAGLPAVALIWFRASKPFGLEAVLFLFLVVWSADTGAYVAGRTLGGPKLVPRISPNKTWAGLGGAVGGSVLMALLFGLAVPGVSVVKLIFAGFLLALISQAGDLLESAMKRQHGVKDTGRLIPGHGGFMDRVDGLIVAVVAAAIFAAAVNVQAPALALLR